MERHILGGIRLLLLSLRATSIKRSVLLHTKFLYSYEHSMKQKIDSKESSSLCVKLLLGSGVDIWFILSYLYITMNKRFGILILLHMLVVRTG